MGTEISDRRVEALFRGATGPVGVSLRAASTSLWMSDDGSTVTLSDQATERYSAYLMKAGTAAVRLGDGQAFDVSPDGRLDAGAAGFAGAAAPDRCRRVTRVCRTLRSWSSVSSRGYPTAAGL